MRRASPWLAALFFVGFLALGYVYLERDAESARLAVDGDVFSRDKDKQMQTLRRQLVDAKAAQAEADKHLAEIPKAPPPPAADAPVRTGPQVIHFSDMIRDHPEFAALQERQNRRNMIRQYGAILDGLNLPPDTLAKLKDLLTQQSGGNAAAQQAAAAAGLQPGTQEWRDAIRQSAQQIQQEITATLQSGGSTLNWQQLQAKAGMNSQVQYTYGPDLAGAGVPLSSDQSNALVQAMADANYSGKDLSLRPQGYNTPDPSTGLTPHQNQILTNASSSLSPAQLEVIKADQLETAQQAAIFKQYASGGQPVRFVP